MKTWMKLKKKPDLWNKYLIREKVIRSIREFFYENHFHEVETPLLVPALIPESYLDVFETNLLDRKGSKKRMFLTTSPEASLKKLLVAGVGNCFEISKSFRNCETGSKLHNPEFTILEWYRVGASYKDVMQDCENLLIYIFNKVKSRKDDFKITYQGKIIDITPLWERISVSEAFQKYADISFAEISEIKNGKVFFPVDHFADIARKKGYTIEKKNSWEEIFHQIFFNEVEPHLGKGGKPTIIYDYPRPLAALSKVKETDPRFAERFEFYIGGLELGNCYTELTDFEEHKKRFDSEMQLIRSLKKTLPVPDQDFLNALREGLPPCSGIGIGVDRLIMLFSDTKTIQETLLFPISEMIEV